MKADIDFENGTITLVCSKCRRKHLKQIADTKLGLQIKCKCKIVISWQGDLTWVTCYARPYQWNGAALSLENSQISPASDPSSLEPNAATRRSP